MNTFEKTLQKQFGEETFKRIQSTRIGIAGAGGLGSNCAANLVRSGFRDFKIIDFDVIEHSNLNRQFYFEDQIGMDKVEALSVNLKKINPGINIAAGKIRLSNDNIEEIFSDCRIIVEAFDAAESKKMLVEKLIMKKELIVAASGLAGVGKSDGIKVHWIRKNLAVIGDMQSDNRDNPPVSPRVNIAAAKQADVILAYIMGNVSS